MNKDITFLAVGSAIALFGCVVMIIAVVFMFGEHSEAKWLAGISMPLILAGAFLALAPRKLTIGKWANADFGGGDNIEEMQPDTLDAAGIEHKTLPPEVRRKKEAYARDLPIPGRDAPPFKLVTDVFTSGPIPSAEPFVPMYVLDNNYRILDWNNAFSLAFDRTMDGMRGLSVEQWVYYLENSEEVFSRAARDFGDPDNLPLVHVEDLEYKSNRYGSITGMKRAYQVFGDDQRRLGWLTILDPAFSETDSENRYKLDLIRMLRMDLVWSEYAVSYDACLANTDSYLSLISMMLGESPGGPDRIANDARVLDLGAGSGNLALRLAKTGNRVIYAMENNVAMLQQLRTKCRQHLVDNESDPGIRAIKQDIQSLRGLDDESFDVVLMNNVAYALDDVRSVFRQVYKKLRRGGELRVSGPKADTDLQALFDQLEIDLRKHANYESLKGHFERVKQINFTYLKPILFQWSLAQMKELLADTKFTEISFETDQAYAGQAMVVCARKKKQDSIADSY